MAATDWTSRLLLAEQSLLGTRSSPRSARTQAPSPLLAGAPGRGRLSSPRPLPNTSPTPVASSPAAANQGSPDFFGRLWGEGAARHFSIEGNILDPNGLRLAPLAGSLVCPMTLNSMTDPVLAVDGCAYEREYIQTWFRQKAHQNRSMTSPATGLDLASTLLVPLAAIRSAIEAFIRSRPELKAEWLAKRSAEEASELLQRELLESRATQEGLRDRFNSAEAKAQAFDAIKVDNEVLLSELRELRMHNANLESEFNFVTSMTDSLEEELRSAVDKICYDITPTVSSANLESCSNGVSATAESADGCASICQSCTVLQACSVNPPVTSSCSQNNCGVLDTVRSLSLSPEPSLFGDVCAMAMESERDISEMPQLGHFPEMHLQESTESVPCTFAKSSRNPEDHSARLYGSAVPVVISEMQDSITTAFSLPAACPYASKSDGHKSSKVKTDQSDVMHCMHAAGADTICSDFTGRTPLAIALSRLNVEVVKYLGGSDMTQNRFENAIHVAPHIATDHTQIESMPCPFRTITHADTVDAAQQSPLTRDREEDRSPVEPHSDGLSDGMQSSQEFHTFPASIVIGHGHLQAQSCFDIENGALKCGDVLRDQPLCHEVWENRAVALRSMYNVGANRDPTWADEEPLCDSRASEGQAEDAPSFCGIIDKEFGDDTIHESKCPPALVPGMKSTAIDFHNSLIGMARVNNHADPFEPELIPYWEGSPLLCVAVENSRLDVVQALCDAGVDKNAPNRQGFTPLLLAVSRASAHPAIPPCEIGIEVRGVGPECPSLSPSSAANRELEIVRCLCRAGVDENKPGPDGLTPLCVAAQRGCVEVVRCLCDAGASRRSCSEGMDPLSLAAREGHLEVVMLLLADGPLEGSPLCHAAERGHVAVVRCLIGAGIDMDGANARGMTPLLLAAKGGHLKVVRCLCDAGAEEDKADACGQTPLSLAAEEGRLLVVRHLCERQPGPTRHAAELATLAAARGHREVARFLRQRGSSTSSHRNPDR